MKSYKDFKSSINEVLTASDPIEKWIDDFVHSKNTKFAGKSKAERINMAKGAYYGAQRNESAAVSQNTDAEQDMNESHLVHVSDGSKYDEEPHPKDVEHVMAGVKKHSGEHAGASDKGAFFKFPSKEHASSFINHVNKCPHRSCDAHLSEAVEYKGIGTDIVDKKKKLNPQPNLMTTKKTVKDFKEGYEHGPIDRDAKVAVGHKAAVLAGSGLDSGKHGTVVGSSKERTGDMWHIKTASGDIVKMHKHRVAKLKEDLELVDKKKVLAPPIPLTQKKKTVKDFLKNGDIVKEDVDMAAKMATKRAQDATRKAREEDSKEDSDDQHDSHKDAARLHKQAMKHYEKGSADYNHHEKMAKQHSEILGEAVHPAVMAMVKQGAKMADPTDRWSYEKQLTKRGFKKNGNEYTHPSGHKVTIAKHGQSWKDNKGMHGMSAMNLGNHLDKELKLKEGFLSSSEEDDMKNLDRFSFFKKYGRHKNEHQAARGIKTSDLKKYEESVEESRGHKVLKTFFKNREVAQKAFTHDNKPGTYSEKSIETPKKDAEEKKKMMGIPEGKEMPHDEKWTEFVGQKLDATSKLHKKRAGVEDQEEKDKISKQIHAHNKELLNAVKHRGDK